MAAAPRRRKLIGQRRRVEDEGDDEGRPEMLELDDDSLTEGSVVSDDHDGADDSDTSNIDEVSPTSPNARKSANGTAKGAGRRASRAGAQGDGKKSVSDTELMLHGLSIADLPDSAHEMQFDEVTVSPPKSPSAPVIVSSSSAMRPQPAQPANRRRQEHEDYKRRRDEDPAFVPNRGSFFMHDHRHPGPAANGFRPFGRGRGRGGGRGGVGGPFAPINHLHHPADPTTNSPWTHDMHEAVADVIPRRPRQAPNEEGPPNGNGFIPTCEPSATPINRTLSTEKHIGNAQVRVILPETTTPKVFSSIPVKQYTKLPDHRPPLRRDKPVRISLPNHLPRYIFPASDRSFTFIPRALRPNQQRLRGKPRSAWGSVGGFSRRTSVFGGSYYGGSIYSPSVAVSRRSSIVAHDREAVFSPTGSIISRPAPQADNRPVVRLPPAPQTFNMPAFGMEEPAGRPEALMAAGQETSIVDIPQPQTHPLPQKPNFQENLSASIPMHQPRPQKNISVADIESPTLSQNASAFQQAFHQQVPLQMANGYQDSHARRPSHPTHVSTGTPLSQIPERAIHAAPFQPNAYGQAAFYGQQPYQPHPQQGYYYSHGYSGPSMPASAVTAPPFIPQGQPGMPGSFTPQNQVEQPAVNMSGPSAPPNTNLVAQEVNGMVYYYDASQLPSVNPYPPYPTSQPYQPSVMGMGGMVTPSPDGFYYPQPAPGMVFYSQ
ncbi:CASC3/Barentsz eIF4AIII binding domain-containing protein [Trichoderma ceciliae]